MEGLNPKVPNRSRRNLLKCGLGAAISTLAGCGGGSDASSPLGSAPAPAPVPVPAPPPAAPAAWNPNVPALLVGSNATFNLSNTLPSGVQRGGRFGVDPYGAALPAGMQLASAGILSVGTASIGTVNGVIFTYETP